MEGSIVGVLWIVSWPTFISERSPSGQLEISGELCCVRVTAYLGKSRKWHLCSVEKVNKCITSTHPPMMSPMKSIVALTVHVVIRWDASPLESMRLFHLVFTWRGVSSCTQIIDFIFINEK